MAQAESLSEATWTAYRKLWNFTYQGPQLTPPLSLESLDNHGLDSSQIELNPFFRRRTEIDLLVRPNCITTSTFANLDSLNHSIRPIFVVQSPYKGLEIHIITSPMHDHDNGHYPTLLARIRDDDGVRIGQLLDTIHSNSPAVVASWVADAEYHRDRLPSRCWRTFSIGHGRKYRKEYRACH
jgi:hypothetical protein